MLRAALPLLIALLAVLPAVAGRRVSDSRIDAGLKEALEISAGNAVDVTGRLDGYFRNKAIKILMPSKLKSAEKVLRTLGHGKKVDDFVLSMNRAAEKAAPQARGIFTDAIRDLTFSDVRQILGGGDTAATDYFREKTTGRLTDAFHPIVKKSLDETGATRQYKQLMGRVQDLPFGGVVSFDLDDYVVGKGLDGLFLMLGREEQKIRRDPVARVTDLLKDVFGR
jgi:hypothetical protein